MERKREKKRGSDGGWLRQDKTRQDKTRQDARGNAEMMS
jgi:hypothetical protein